MKNDFVIEGKTSKYHVKYLECLKSKARENRRSPTLAEELIWKNILRNKYTGFKFTRQKPIGKFIADFYCSELLLIIEIDGDSHDMKSDYDMERDKYLECLGIKTLRIKNEEIVSTIKEAKRNVMRVLEKRREEIKTILNPPLSARGGLSTG